MPSKWGEAQHRHCPPGHHRSEDLWPFYWCFAFFLNVASALVVINANQMRRQSKGVCSCHFVYNSYVCFVVCLATILTVQRNDLQLSFIPNQPHFLVIDLADLSSSTKTSFSLLSIACYLFVTRHLFADRAATATAPTPPRRWAECFRRATINRRTRPNKGG